MNNQGEELVVVRTPSTVVDGVEKQHLIPITCTTRSMCFITEDGIRYIMCLGYKT